MLSTIIFSWIKKTKTKTVEFIQYSFGSAVYEGKINKSRDFCLISAVDDLKTSPDMEITRSVTNNRGEIP